MFKILIVDDDQNMQVLLNAKLSAEYEIYFANDGKEALDLFDVIHFDLALVDIMMPKINGYDVVSKLRTKGILTPIIMITAKSDINDKIHGFDIGIDDYMTKPINLDELSARVRSLFRRNKINQNKELSIHNILLNKNNYSIKKGKIITYLPQKEFELLFKLLSFPNIIFSMEQLFEDIWGTDSTSDETTVRTHINRVRSKISQFEEFDIVTIRGIGYKGMVQ